MGQNNSYERPYQLELSTTRITDGFSKTVNNYIGGTDSLVSFVMRLYLYVRFFRTTSWIFIKLKNDKYPWSLTRLSVVVFSQIPKAIDPGCAKIGRRGLLITNSSSGNKAMI